MQARFLPPRKAMLDCWAFCLSAVLAPVCFAAAGLLVFGVGALVTVPTALFGLPAYLLLGLPAAAFVITRYPRPDGRADLAGLMAAGIGVSLGGLVLALLLLTLSALLGQERLAGLAENLNVYFGLGLIAAPLQAAVFGRLYLAMARPQALQTDPDIFA